MTGKPQEPEKDEPKQVTPKGYEIPVPTRETVLSFFRKVAKPKKG